MQDHRNLSMTKICIIIKSWLPFSFIFDFLAALTLGVFVG
jgi:hypothetical protein